MHIKSAITRICAFFFTFVFVFTMSLSLMAATNSAVGPRIGEEILKWPPARVVAPKKKAAEEKSELAAVKKFEMERQWPSCAQKAAQVFGHMGDLQPWILTTWMKCARRTITANISSANLAFASSPLAQASKNSQWFEKGPWRELLFQEMVRLRLAVVEAGTKLGKPSLVQIEELLQMRERLDKETLGRVWAAAGENAIKSNQPDAAEYYFQLSLNAKESRYVRDRLSNVRTLLKKPADSKKDSITEILPEDEARYDEAMQNALKQNDLIGYLENAVHYLNRFPGGKRARGVIERTSEIFQSISDSARKDPSSDKFRAARTRMMDTLLKLSTAPLEELARWSHRRNEFASSLELADRALGETASSTATGTLLYVAGRSAHILGQYARALNYFERYGREYSGGDDISEVLFRSGLCHLRLNQWAQAVTVFDRLLNSRGIDRYETSARYWLVQALRAQSSPRAKEEAKELITRQPFSYYGIRLAAEQNQDQFEWKAEAQTPLQLEAKHFVLPYESLAVARAQRLMDHGWMAEAQLEMAQLPLPQQTQAQILWASRLKELGAYPQIVRLVNEAFADNSEMRDLSVLALSFPKPFTERIEEEARINALSPVLIRSLIRQESAFNLRAVSSSQALGLMQLIPPTAEELATDLRIEKLVLPEDAFETGTNIKMGSRYLAKVIRQFNGNVPMGLAAYNAGPARLNMFIEARDQTKDLVKNFSSLPQDEIWFDEIPWYETSFYIKAILRNVILYKALDDGRVKLSGVFWQDLIKGPEVSANRHSTGKPKRDRWTSSVLSR